MNLSKMTTRANTSIRNQTRRGQSLAGPQCLGVSFCVLSLLSAAGATHELSNASFQLILKQEGDAVEASLTLKPARLQVAAGPYLCQAELADAPPGPVLSGLSNTKISPGPRSLTIRGRLAGFSGYRYTNPQTQHELRRLVKEVVEPLGPTLMQVPDRKSDVAYLESFASQMFARRGTYGWGHTWRGDAYQMMMWAQLQPEIVYDESVAQRGLDGFRVQRQRGQVSTSDIR